MDCHKLESLQIVSLPRDWHSMDTGKPKQLLDYGHMTLSITFSLVVDDFGVKYEGLANTHHLIKAL
jgi:hypothetical protein